jgi:hypothetical protein
MMFYSQSVQSVPKSWRIYKVHLVMQPPDFVSFGMLFLPLGGGVGVWGKSVWEEPVGHQSLEERNQEVDAKKEVCQKDSRIRGEKRME